MSSFSSCTVWTDIKTGGKSGFYRLNNEVDGACVPITVSCSFSVCSPVTTIDRSRTDQSLAAWSESEHEARKVPALTGKNWRHQGLSWVFCSTLWPHLLKSPVHPRRSPEDCLMLLIYQMRWLTRHCWALNPLSCLFASRLRFTLQPLRTKWPDQALPADVPVRLTGPPCWEAIVGITQQEREGSVV